jgi:hypothetical protein
MPPWSRLDRAACSGTCRCYTYLQPSTRRPPNPVRWWPSKKIVKGRNQRWQQNQQYHKYMEPVKLMWQIMNTMSGQIKLCVYLTEMQLIKLNVVFEFNFWGSLVLCFFIKHFHEHTAKNGTKNWKQLSQKWKFPATCPIPFVGIYKLLTDAWIWKLGTRPRSLISGNT